MTGENRLANAQAEIAAAKDALRVAEAALSLGIRRDAMSRTYYAAFHAARALLLLEGLEPKTHAGLQRMLGEYLVRGGRIEAHDALLLTRLQAYRAASDYSYAFEIGAADAEGELSAARAFVGRAASAVAALGSG